MGQAVDKPSKDVYNLIRLKYGDPSSPSYIAFTNWTSDIPGNPVYTSEPTMEVELPENNGIFSDETCNISLPMTNSWFANIVSNIALTPITIVVEEITKPEFGSDTSNRSILFRGELSRTIRNYQGKSHYSIAQFSSPKSMLDVKMGIPANHQCGNTFFGTLCKKSRSGLSNNIIVADIDGKILTASASPAGRTGKFFHRGYLELEGLIIDIRDWDAATGDTFYLIDQPPTTWIGRTIVAWAGCDKTYNTCKNRHNNEANFNGTGYAIPAYNPLLENPE